MVLQPPTMGRYDQRVNISDILCKGKAVCVPSTEYIHFLEQSCCKNTELAPCTVDVSGIAFMRLI